MSTLSSNSLTSVDCINSAVTNRRPTISKFGDKTGFRKKTHIKDMTYVIKKDHCVKIHAFPPSWSKLSPTVLLFNQDETLESVLWNYMLFCGVPNRIPHKRMLEKGWKDLPGFFCVSTNSRMFYLNWIPGLSFLKLKDLCTAAHQNTLSLQYVTCSPGYWFKSNIEYHRMYARLIDGYNLFCSWLFPKYLK